MFMYKDSGTSGKMSEGFGLGEVLLVRNKLFLFFFAFCSFNNSTELFTFGMFCAF